MDKESTNFNKILRSFKDQWVAVSDDYSKVFANGETLENVANKVKNLKNIKVFRVIPFGGVYSP